METRRLWRRESPVASSNASPSVIDRRERVARCDRITVRYVSSALTKVKRPHQPIEPSICSSISLDHSTAYSIGNVRVTGSINPFTIRLMA